METNEITGKIINCAIKVHKVLGPGLLESAYEKCLAYELRKNGLKVESQKEMSITYEDVVIDSGYRIDLLVEDSVIVELKSVTEMKPIFKAQTLTYLKLAKLKVALLINFNEVLLKDGIKRLIM
ncbi:MAG: GxxExxY protein [Paludibacteraceae bacterium]|nr:GxxExxY protein [Paludibacteraceae bacterium]MEE1082379.1 GxxExxY protein [Paludibacteraceae bacterium]